MKIALTLAALMVSTTALAEDRRSPVAINYDVNSRIEYTSDGKVDDWQMPTDEGDCEDFALLKRKMLLEGGWDEKDVELILVVRTKDLKKGGVIDFAHVVVYVRSIDMVLDIKPTYQGVGSITTTEYSFAKYMETMRYSPVCKMKDLSYGIKGTATERCGAWFPIKK